MLLCYQLPVLCFLLYFLKSSFKAESVLFALMSCLGCNFHSVALEQKRTPLHCMKCV